MMKPRLRVYANGWSNGSDPDSIAKQALEVVNKRGFNALKFDPFVGPWREYVPKNEIDHAVKIVKNVNKYCKPRSVAFNCDVNSAGVLSLNH